MEKLIEAIDNEDSKTVKNLLKNGLKIDFVGSIRDYDDNYGSDGENVLNYASDHDSVEILKLLLDNGGREYINYTFRYNAGKSGTALHAAAAHGNLEIIKLLLDYGADVNARNERGETPLFGAIYVDTGDYDEDQIRYGEIVDLLLEYGADIDAVNNEGNTAMLEASIIEGMHSNYIYKLFNMGTDVNIANNNGENMLMLCLNKKGDRFLASFSDLVRRSTIETINAQDIDGRTPLIHAIIAITENRNLDDADVAEFVEALLEAGADINIIDDYGYNALLYAISENNMEIIQVLINHGARLENVNIRDNEGKTPLMHVVINAIEKPYITQVEVIENIERLLRAGADINAVDNNGYSALLHAMSRNNLGIAQILINHGARLENVDNRDNEGKTPLMRAVIKAVKKRYVIDVDKNYDAEEAEAIENIERLLQAGADINAVDNNGRSVLLHAMSGDNKERIVQFLINHGAILENINNRDNEGKTPLMRAVIKAVEKRYVIEANRDYDAEEAKAIENIERLLQVGADINAVDNNGYNALLHAMSGDSKKRIVQFLINHGAKFDFNDETVNKVLSNAILTIDADVIENLKRNLMFNTIFDGIDFDNQENKERLLNGLTANGIRANIDIISNANKNALKQIINIASIDFGEEITSPFYNVNAPMRDFINFGVATSGTVLTTEEENDLNNIAIRFDNAAMHGNGDEIKNCINNLFELCKTSRNIFDVVDSIIDKDVVYMDSRISLTKLLNIYGFNTKLFNDQMQLFDAQMQADEIFRRNGIVNRMPNNNEKSIINKSFELIYRTILDEDFDILSQNEDINNACLVYQQNKTELNKQNLINVIIDNTNNEDKKLLVNCLANMKYFKINNKDINLATIISIATNSNLGKRLFLRLRQELQLNNVANANNALNNNQQQLQ